MQPTPTQAPGATGQPQPDPRAARLRRVRGRIVRLLAAWTALAAVLFVLRGLLTDPFWSGLFLPIAFAVVLVAGVLTLRAARVRERIRERRAKERRLRDRRRE